MKTYSIEFNGIITLSLDEKAMNEAPGYCEQAEIIEQAIRKMNAEELRSSIQNVLPVYSDEDGLFVSDED